ncbi:MAG TPA: choice-of-anchor I family protein [Vicinamibacterales bacterium]|nr:choice-of-anchor I family protein [Vicinamibacterales bacterium]
MRVTSRVLVGSALIALAMTATGGTRLASAPPDKFIELVPLGQYQTGIFEKVAAEIVAYDPATRRVFSVNVALSQIDIIDVSDPLKPFLTAIIDVSPYGAQANSVAVKDGVVAVAVEATVKQNPGKAVFFTAFGSPLSEVTVGALPDMITFSPNGDLVLVANEGEPNGAYTIDPEGSVSIIDIRGGVASLSQSDVTTAGFGGFSRASLDPSIRIFGPGASVAQDLEPEYIAVSHNSHTAWVTLQENNALAIIDLKAKRVVDLVGLGFKNHLLSRNKLDASDSDGGPNITTWPVWGMFLPDGIATFESQGKSYVVTANEGDAREYAGFNAAGNESRRVGIIGSASNPPIPLDPTAFPNAGTLQTATALGRLNISTAMGDTDNDGDFDRLFAFGARSFSIWSETGALVFDSGDDLEQRTLALLPNGFNANNTGNARDSRSDDKGPEPEGVAVAKLYGRTFIFIALERVGGVIVYEVGDPTAPTFVQYINTRDFSRAASATTDSGPESIVVRG